ncbi:MAG: hypothetical protein LIO65_04490, partial [Odoribacter sp.]|nr:hypothetical protein [Odoribacter sp.]
IQEITRQLEDKDNQIRYQAQQIEDLNVNVENLNKQTENHIEVIQQQDKKNTYSLLFSRNT